MLCLHRYPNIDVFTLLAVASPPTAPLVRSLNRAKFFGLVALTKSRRWRRQALLASADIGSGRNQKLCALLQSYAWAQIYEDRASRTNRMSRRYESYYYGYLRRSRA